MAGRGHRRVRGSTGRGRREAQEGPARRVDWAAYDQSSPEARRGCSRRAVGLALTCFPLRSPTAGGHAKSARGRPGGRRPSATGRKKPRCRQSVLPQTKQHGTFPPPVPFPPSSRKRPRPCSAARRSPPGHPHHTHPTVGRPPCAARSQLPPPAAKRRPPPSPTAVTAAPTRSAPVLARAGPLRRSTATAQHVLLPPWDLNQQPSRRHRVRETPPLTGPDTPPGAGGGAAHESRATRCWFSRAGGAGARPTRRRHAWKDTASGPTTRAGARGDWRLRRGRAARGGTG